MKEYFQKNGLSARRKTIKPLATVLRPLHDQSRSMASLTLIAMLTIVLTACHDKTNGQTTETKKEQPEAALSDSLSKPKTDIKVNRHYDDKGNLIGFDSTYTSYYSNVQGDTTRMDSLMKQFDRYFSINHSRWFDNRFNNLFFNDSLRYPDFFHNDFFMKRYEMNNLYLKDMMHRMDSIKNQFYHDKSRKKNKST